MGRQEYYVLMLILFTSCSDKDEMSDDLHWILYRTIERQDVLIERMVRKWEML